MTRLSDAQEFLDGLSRLSQQQWLLRAVVAVSPAVAFGVEVQAGAPVQTLPVVLLALFTSISVLLPDSHAPLAVLLVLIGYWAIGVDEQLSVALLVVTALVIVFHVACLLASYGPPSVVVDAVLANRWLVRALAGFTCAVLVWTAGRLATSLDLTANGWLVAVALVLVVAWGGLLSHRLVLQPGEQDRHGF